MLVPRFTLFAFVATLITIGPATAQTVMVGPYKNNNYGTCYPFSCPLHPDIGVLTRYQQVYSSNIFSGLGPVLINQLTVFNTWWSGSFASAEFLIAFSTTSAGVNGLSANLDANVGADNAAFASLVTTSPYPWIDSSFVIPGNPFLYDPSAGNLLMDIFVNASADAYYYALLDAVYNEPLTSRAWVVNGLGEIDNPAYSGGLVTEFTYAPAVSVVPEPSTWLLLGTGLGLIGGATWVRRRRRGEASSP